MHGIALLLCALLHIRGNHRAGPQKVRASSRRDVTRRILRFCVMSSSSTQKRQLAVEQSKFLNWPLALAQVQMRRLGVPWDGDPPHAECQGRSHGVAELAVPTRTLRSPNCVNCLNSALRLTQRKVSFLCGLSTRDTVQHTPGPSRRVPSHVFLLSCSSSRESQR